MDVRRLDRLVTDFQSVAFAANTVKTYRTHRRAYLSFCARLHCQPVPASPLLLCRYVAFLSTRLCFNSIKQYLNIVALMHKECGLPSPLGNCFQLSLTLRGIRRTLGDRVTRKLPITPRHLYLILQGLDIKVPRDAAVFAACLLMFFGLLRRSNVLPPSGGAFDPLRHLRRSDVSFASGGARLLFRWSKTDQFGSRPRVVPYPRIRGHPLCPTQALFQALRLTPAAPPDGPLFVTRSAPQAPALSPAMFSKVFLSALRRSSADTTGLASHSFRRGGAVFLWSSAGLDEGRIRELGDWASSAYTAYVISDVSGLARTTAAMADALPSVSDLRTPV